MGKISLILILLIFSVNRCELLDKELNYILVTVNMTVGVRDQKTQLYVPGVSVKMLIQKAGGEKVEGIGTTGSEGETATTGTFKLYREQPIDASAWLIDRPDDVHYLTLPWDVVESGATEPDDDGLRTYSWKADFMFYR